MEPCAFVVSKAWCWAHIVFLKTRIMNLGTIYVEEGGVGPDVGQRQGQEHKRSSATTCGNITSVCAYL